MYQRPLCPKTDTVQPRPVNSQRTICVRGSASLSTSDPAMSDAVHALCGHNNDAILERATQAASLMLTAHTQSLLLVTSRTFCQCAEPLLHMFLTMGRLAAAPQMSLKRGEPFAGGSWDSVEVRRGQRCQGQLQALQQPKPLAGVWRGM